MRLLQYKDLNLRRVEAAFDKFKAAIESGDFRAADVKKLNAGPYYRAKLDYANQLLLQFARIDRPEADGGTETVCLALEVIENHAYDRSRFLRGAVVDENRIERELAADDGSGPGQRLPGHACRNPGLDGVRPWACTGTWESQPRRRSHKHGRMSRHAPTATWTSWPRSTGQPRRHATSAGNSFSRTCSGGGWAW